MFCRKFPGLCLRLQQFWAALCLTILLGFAPAVMSQAQTDCATELAEAEQKFYDASFDEAIAMADRCLRQNDLPLAAQLRAHRLLAMAYQATGDMNRATEAIRTLLQLASNYQADPVQDPPRYVELVEQVRREQPSAALEPPALQQLPPPGGSETSKKKKGGAAKWLLLGGGAGVAVIVAVVRGAGGDDKIAPPRQSLPAPPTLP